MELFYRDEEGIEHVWTELEEGIYELRPIQDGKRLTWSIADELPQAISLAQFSICKPAIAKRLSFRMFDPVTELNTPISVKEIFDIIDGVIKYSSKEE